MPSLEEELAARLAKGEEVVLATVIRLDGEPPSRTGAKLLMSRNSTLAGTLGCSEFDELMTYLKSCDSIKTFRTSSVTSEAGETKNWL